MRKTEKEYLKGLSDDGLTLYTWLKKTGTDKKEIAEEMGISLEALNYKLKGKNGGFNKLESFYLNRLMNEI